MGPIQSFGDLLDLFRRRSLLIIPVFLAGVLLTFLYLSGRPAIYEAIAVIQVEGPVVGETPGTPGSQSARMLQTIEQRLTARENALAIIERHGLFADVPGMTNDQKIFALRQSIAFQRVAADSGQAFGAPSSVSALIITARFENPDQAARIANDLAQNVLDMSVERKFLRARETYSFFVTEENRVAAEIAALEAELTAYQNANFATIGALEQDDRTGIETTLREVTQQLLAVRTESEMMAQRDRLRETDRRRMQELDVQESLLTRQQGALQDQLNEMAARSAAAPEVQQTLNAYERRLEQMQDQYDAITLRRNEAETALRLEDEQQSERFSLLERAVVPSLPSSSGRMKYGVAGLGASMILALGIAVLLDLLNPVIRSAAQMERALNIRPVITIPELPIHRPRRRFFGWLRQGHSQ